MPNGLGELQAKLLVEIYERHLDYAEHHFLRWEIGVDWHSWCPTRAESAARSRALKQLEAYGLIKRVNRVSGQGRLTHVQIRPSGIAIAEQLTNKRGVWLLTVGTLTVPTLRPMTAEEFDQAIERIKRETLH